MRRPYALLALGVIVCVIGALLMAEGSILGERTTGLATVVGIVGIGLISSSSNAPRRRVRP
jgi:hypothetical protein